jgi:hypothetical protein
MAENRLSFRATVSREGDEWVAHCLDLDIVTVATTPDQAMDRLADAVGAQLWYAKMHDNFAYLFKPAPLAAWERLGEILRGPYRTIVKEVDDSDRGVKLEAQLVAA